MDEFAYLTIEPGEGFYVPLGLYEISTQDEINLDVYEGYPNLYEKEYLQIEYNGQKVDALIYVMKDNFSYHRPSKIYIETCEEGYLDFGFDKSILDEALKYSLKNIPDTLKRGL